MSGPVPVPFLPGVSHFALQQWLFLANRTQSWASSCSLARFHILGHRNLCLFDTDAHNPQVKKSLVCRDLYALQRLP